MIHQGSSVIHWAYRKKIFSGHSRVVKFFLYSLILAIFTNRLNLTPEQIKSGLAETDLKSMLRDNTAVEGCEAQFNFTSCRRNDRYRTFDGTCNNLRHPSWGMAASCFERLVDPDYSDGK